MKRLLSILFLFSAILFTSCLKNDNAAPDVPVAALKIVNAYTDAQAIVIMADNNYITSPNAPLLYNTFTRNFTFLYPGNRRLKVYNTDNKVVSDKLFSLKDSTYTSFIFGNTVEAKNLILKDTTVKDLGTKSALRFLHLASNIQKVNVYLNNTQTPIYTNRLPEVETPTNPSTIGKFIGQASGKHKIIITDEQNNKIVEREYEFEAGRYYSIILTGDKNSTGKPPYIGVVYQF